MGHMKYEENMIRYAQKQQDICRRNDTISDHLFEEYGVNRGLRDKAGKGVRDGGSAGEDQQAAGQQRRRPEGELVRHDHDDHQDQHFHGAGK